MFHKRFIRHNFNMVEVMLAVIVVAMGIASTFVLFPVGLNASKEAIAENQVAEISESAAMIIQAEIVSKIIGDAGKGYEFKVDSTQFCSRPKDSDTGGINNALNADEIAVEGNQIVGTELYKLENGHYLYAQKESSGSVVFAAAVKVYLDRKDANDSGFGDEYFYNADKGKPEKYSEFDVSKGYQNIHKFLLPVAVEVSWPVTLEYSEREKRVYRFEIFNSDYDVLKDEDAEKS